MKNYEYESRYDIVDDCELKWYWFEVLAGDKVKDAVTLGTDLQDAIDNIECWYDDLEGWHLIDILSFEDRKPYGCEVI